MEEIGCRIAAGDAVFLRTEKHLYCVGVRSTEGVLP
jgi:hypothetical protein